MAARYHVAKLQRSQAGYLIYITAPMRCELDWDKGDTLALYVVNGCLVVQKIDVDGALIRVRGNYEVDTHSGG